MDKDELKRVVELFNFKLEKMENKLSNQIIGAAIKEPLYIDILVQGAVIVEVKATEKNHPIFETQVLTYLRLTGKKLGLVVNFGNSHVRNGISRVVNGL